MTPNFSKWILAMVTIGSVTVAFSQTQLKVETSIGEVLLQKAKNNDWKPLKVGAKVKQEEKIRTGVESNVSLTFPNGSLISVGENSLVDFKTLVEKGQESNTTIAVKTGSVMFNVKKLAAGKSNFQFEASTATAAIRGTEGDFRVRGSRTIASLLTGRLDLMNRSGAKATILAGQMALQNAKGFVIIPRPQDPEALKKIVEQYLSDSTEVPQDSMPIVDSTQATQVAPSGSAFCRLVPAPALVNEARIRLTGTASAGTQVSVGASKSITGPDGNWALDVVWSASQVGPKQFAVQGLFEGQNLDCGTASFEYVERQIPLALRLTSPASMKVCGPSMITGSYQGTGARLALRLGSSVIDLSSATGQFSYALNLSDQNRNWDISRAELVLTGVEGTQTQEIDLQADRKCREVNRIPPALVVSVDGARCFGAVNVSQVQGDEVTVSVLADGAEIESFTATSDVRGRRMNLLPGNHRYTVRAVDLAGNRTEKDFKDVGCYPDVRFELSLSGPAREVLRLPPPPPGQSRSVSRTVDASVLNLPGDDPKYLKRITFKHNGRVIRNLTGTQIRDVRFSVDLDLLRGSPNVLIFEAELQNGRIRTVSKEYDFR